MIIEWYGHASFKIKTNNKVIYIDPHANFDHPDFYQEKADVILVSQNHFDHFDMEKINKIRIDDTIIFANRAVAHLIHEAKEMHPGNFWHEEGIKITAVKAVSAEEVREYKIGDHIKAGTEDAIGFLIEVEGHKVYFASDTLLFDEMEGIKCDIMLVPIGGTYTMNYIQAAEAVKRVKPIMAIPMNYGARVRHEGVDVDYYADEFVHEVRKVSDADVKVLEVGKKYEF